MKCIVCKITYFNSIAIVIVVIFCKNQLQGVKYVQRLQQKQ